MSTLYGCPFVGADCGKCGKLDTFNTSLLDEIASLDTKIIIHCRYCDEPLITLNPDEEDRPVADAPKEIGAWQTHPEEPIEKGERWEPWDDPELNAPRGVRYVRGDIAGKDRRERARLLELAKAARNALRPSPDSSIGAHPLLSKLDAAIAECEGI